MLYDIDVKSKFQDRISLAQERAPRINKGDYIKLKRFRAGEMA